MTHWRPISLMGCLYKTFLKVLANRLHKILPDLIHPAQYGFIKECNILHIILNVQIGIDYVKKTNQEVVMVQLDLEKAFDYVSWSFLAELMHTMGFGPRMCRLIYTLGLDSISQIVINGGATSPVSLTHSLRQECPLSPLLFALITHPMLTLLTQLAQNGEVVGLTLPAGQQLVGQALAHDSFMFLKAFKVNIDRAMGHVVPHGTIVCHLGYPIGVDVSNKQLLEFISGHIANKFRWFLFQAMCNDSQPWVDMSIVLLEHVGIWYGKTRIATSWWDVVNGSQPVHVLASPLLDHLVQSWQEVLGYTSWRPLDCHRDANSLLADSCLRLA
ncbi:hypothetical protein L7F22_058519 [Adiantum nelumboides]|nr:hypothetical protein [Adiantum nelumboides]